MGYDPRREKPPWVKDNPAVATETSKQWRKAAREIKEAAEIRRRERLSRMETAFWLAIPVLAAWKAVEIILWAIR